MLKSYGDWLYELVERLLPSNTPPPPGYERYEDWFRRIRGLDPVTFEPVPEGRLTSIAPAPAPPPLPAFTTAHRETCALKDYSEWIWERTQRLLPYDAPPPPGYESYEGWFRRMRGIDPRTGEPIPEERPSSPERIPHHRVAKPVRHER